MCGGLEAAVYFRYQCAHGPLPPLCYHPPRARSHFLQYEGGGDDSYYDDGAGAGGGTGYAHDDYGDDYGGNDGGDDGGYELTPVSNAGGAGSGSRFGGWFGKKGAKEPAAIEW